MPDPDFRTIVERQRAALASQRQEIARLQAQLRATEQARDIALKVGATGFSRRPPKVDAIPVWQGTLTAVRPRG